MSFLPYQQLFTIRITMQRRMQRFFWECRFQQEISEQEPKQKETIVNFEE